jgi:CRP-like cAMP-binding protein
MLPTHTRNLLLAAFAAPDLDRWGSKLQPVELRSGDTLDTAAASAGFAYFPTTAIIALCHPIAGGRLAEVALIGREGMAGLSSVLGEDSALSLAVVSKPGAAFRVPTSEFQQALHERDEVAVILLRYAQALLIQIGQGAVCNGRHSLPRRLSRRLLLELDRVDGDRLSITHDQLASALGVRRGSVTECALELQRAAIIRYAHGRVTILDRQALQQRSCECYGLVELEYTRLLKVAGQRHR